MSKEIRYCEDCAFYDAGNGPELAECASPEDRSGVVFRGERRWKYCAAARTAVPEVGGCGPEGRWWKPKEGK